MKIAHFGNFSPHRAGIHSAARDLILAERSVGIDSNYIDWGSEKDATFSRVWLKDGKIESVSPDWAYEADILVHHSCIPERIEKLEKPTVMYLHGRPEYSFILDWENKTGCLREEMHRTTLSRYKKFITFWKSHLSTWRYLLPKADLAYVSPPIDLEAYKIEGKKYQFTEKEKGSPNILICDMWREDITPFNTVIAALKFVEKYCPTAKIHVIAVPVPGKDNPVIDPMFGELRKTYHLGKIATIVSNLDEIMRACDFMISPIGIETRTILEATAIGLPVVAGTKNPLGLYTADPRCIDDTVSAIKKCWNSIKNYKGDIKQDTRKKLEENFGLEHTGNMVKKIYEEVLSS